MSLNVRGEGKRSSEEATPFYRSSVGINSMVQEGQCNLRGMGSDTGPGCDIHVFMVVFIRVQKRERA